MKRLGYIQFTSQGGDLGGIISNMMGKHLPHENYRAPRSWTERAYHDHIYYNRVDKGGHFAAWEQPQLFAEEVRAGLETAA